MFSFNGNISASKSWLNRALVIQHFNPALKVDAFSASDDVISLQKAILQIGRALIFNLGMGGTSFRFFVFLISRYKGEWVLKAHDRLLERPQQELIHVLNQLGVKSEFGSGELRLQSTGWQPQSKIVCSADLSSQFASGLLLSCWNLDVDLEIEINKPITSLGYLQMTFELLKEAGMNLQIIENEKNLSVKIVKNQKSKVTELKSELDVSSAFSLASAAVTGGQVEIKNWNNNSKQPDLEFLEIFKKMKIDFSISQKNFSISQQKSWNSVEQDLNNSPDLFPVLSVLCAFASGISVLKGASQLKHKESDRIHKTQELLNLAGYKTEILKDGLKIFGQSSDQLLSKKIVFDPDHDHRMAMAAALIRLKGYNIVIQNPEVVNKSYPNFWKDIGLQPLKRVLIGHRGVGKTQLLKRHQEYVQNIQHFDLDLEIEKMTDTKISDYFLKRGEADFRKTEKSVFNKLISENTEFVISVGAGFDLSGLPKNIEAIFVSRVTDKDGRIFLNRPRLESSISPIEEYQKRYSDRHQNYLQAANSIYYISEGLEVINTTEKKILCHSFEVKDAYYTLTLQDLPSIETRLKTYKKIELRTDLLKLMIIEDLLKRYPKHDWLVSIRTNEQIHAPQIDADILFKYNEAQIVSSHDNSIVEGISQLSTIKGKMHLKLSPQVETFSDLIAGHQWQQQDPANRSFLPRSKNGKWLWYRQLAKYFQKINFIRNFTDIADQPSLYEWLTLPNERPNAWGAVLGTPVHHSRSLLEHQNHFDLFTRIDISAEELKEHYQFLKSLGLKYSAVTSPLKETAYELSNSRSKEVDLFKSANTLIIEDNRIRAHNTDLLGFQKLVEAILPSDRVAIWGGGGTLEMMKSVLPQAHAYSSQSGELRDAHLKAHSKYDYLIWAAPRTSQTRWPSDLMQIKTVIDLNYTDNSMGIEFAALRKIRYISGIEMFKAQAKAQQEFWGLNERK